VEVNEGERKRRFTWGRTESLLVIGWFVGFIAFHMVPKWNEARGIVAGKCFFGGRWLECSDWRFLLALLLDALSQFLTPINIALSFVVIYGILNVQKFVAVLRGKQP
jgi:hypothetical protein